MEYKISETKIHNNNNKTDTGTQTDMTMDELSEILN